MLFDLMQQGLLPKQREGKEVNVNINIGFNGQTPDVKVDNDQDDKERIQFCKKYVGGESFQ